MNERRDGPGRLPGSRRRFRVLAMRYSQPALIALAVVAFVLLAALLLTRSRDVRVAQLTKSDIGQVSRFDVRATSPIYVPDEATTRRLRTEAGRATPVVYAHHSNVRQRNLAVLAAAFSAIRVGFKRYDREVAAATKRLRDRARAPGGATIDGGKPRRRSATAPAPKRATTPDGTDAITTRGPTSAAGRALPASRHRPILERLRAFLEKQRPDFVRQVPVTRHEFDALAQMRFSPAAQKAAESLLDHALAGVIVRDKVKLLIDITRGVRLRPAGTETLIPLEKVVQPDAVLDVSAARTRITDAAMDLVPTLPVRLRAALASTARRLVHENLSFDPQATTRNQLRARQKVPVQFWMYPRGFILVRKGDVITADHLGLLEAMAPGATGPNATRTFLGNAFVVALLGLLAWFAIRLRVLMLSLTARDYAFIGAILLFVLFIARSSVSVSDILHERWTEIPLSVFYLSIPVAVGGMLVRLVLPPMVAVLFSFLAAVLVGLMVGSNLHFATYVFVGGFSAALLAGKAQQRSHLLRTGLWIGLVQVGAVLCLTLVAGGAGFPLTEKTTLVESTAAGLFELTFLLDLAAGLASGAISGLVAVALVPVVETTFGYTTDLKYLELANLENPLLKSLFLRAPGTYHHSVVAGTLAEAAAEAIGANPSLARTGAYYHDVGKGKCPHYFAENQRGDNPHNRLTPHMSSLILRKHVKDGVDILRDAKMPRPIIDVCEQHLGSTLIEYFYAKAVTQAREEGGSLPEESDFRYPGPKPQFRESALVFLADSIEAAARSIPEPTQPKLDEMVRRIIRNKFIDGQLDQCELTLRDLDQVARSMTRVLTAIHHTRPQYPSQRKNEEAREAAPKPEIDEDPEGTSPTINLAADPPVERAGRRESGDR